MASRGPAAAATHAAARAPTASSHAKTNGTTDGAASVPHASPTPASAPTTSSPLAGVQHHGRLLRSWFLSLSKHERSCMLVLEDAKTVDSSVDAKLDRGEPARSDDATTIVCNANDEMPRISTRRFVLLPLRPVTLYARHLHSSRLLGMYTRKREKGGDGYFFGSGSVTHCEGLDRISDSSGRQHRHRHHHGSSLMCTGGAESECSFCGSSNATAYDGDILGWLTDDAGSQKRRSSARNRSNSSGATQAASQRKGSSSSSSLLSGLNLADPFAHGASIFNTTSSSSSFSASAATANSQFLFSSKTNPLYHTARDLKAHELELEQSVRLCDTRGYCDTLCVSGDLLEDGTRFVALMDQISQNGFLSTPLFTCYDAKSKVWLWDVTAWFRNRNLFSLGAFIANKLEMVLWMRYWESAGLDPRKVPSGKEYVAGGLVRERLSSKAPLAHFWSVLAAERREKMLTKLILLVEQHAHSLHLQYQALTGERQQPTNTSSSQHEDDDATEDDDDSHCGGASAQSTPTAGPRSLCGASSRTRSHSLPRRHNSFGQADGSSLPPTSPATPSSANSAPAPHAHSTAGLLRPATATPHAASQTSAPTSEHSQTQLSPWSSMQSSFASSAAGSPSASPVFAPPLYHPPSFTLMPNTHHVTSPAPGQLTPTLTHTHTHTHTVTYSPAPPALASLLQRAAGGMDGRLPAHPPSLVPSTSALTAPSQLPSLFKSSWDRDRTVGPDLIRDLMATAAATQVKSALSVEKHKYLTAAYAAAAPDSRLSKEQVEKLKDLDYDFTMAGLDLLAHLLASLTRHNKRHVNAIPRMTRTTTSSPPLPWMPTTNGSDEVSPAPTTVIAQLEAGRESSPRSADSDRTESSSPPAASAIERTPSEPVPSSASSAPIRDSGLGLVVGLSMPQLLLYAEREAASKSIALAAARITSLRDSWPSDVVDDWHFIELLFSSPMSRAHTNLDKLIRRIGLLLQACYAEQIGIDLIMESEDQLQPQASGEHYTASEKAAAKKKAAKKKAKLKKKQAAAGAEPDQESEQAPADVGDTASTTLDAAADDDLVGDGTVIVSSNSNSSLSIDTTPIRPPPSLLPLRAVSADVDFSPLSPAGLTRSLSSHTGPDTDEPWQRVQRKGERKSGSGAHTAHSTPQSRPISARPQRAKDDSFTGTPHVQHSLRTPPPSQSRSHLTMPLSRTTHHSHHNSQPSAMASTGGAPSSVSSSTSASPHFSSTLSFPAFGVRPVSWSAAATTRFKSSASSTSISPSSTGHQTPTAAMRLAMASAARSKDDSYTPAAVRVGTERRASVTGTAMTNLEHAGPLIQSRSFSEAVASTASPAGAHARHSSAGAIAPSTPPQLPHPDFGRVSVTSRSPPVNKVSPSFFPMPQSPLLPTPPLLASNLLNASAYGRMSTLHLAKPVHIQHHPGGPSSVGLSFSSVPAHHFLTHGHQQRAPMVTSYVHGTDDVTLQAWQQKQHLWQQQQLHAHAAQAVPMTSLLTAHGVPPQHARVPRPSSARRPVLDQQPNGALTNDHGGSGRSTIAGRPRSNSAGEDTSAQQKQHQQQQQSFSAFTSATAPADRVAPTPILFSSQPTVLAHDAIPAPVSQAPHVYSTSAPPPLIATSTDERMNTSNLEAPHPKDNERGASSAEPPSRRTSSLLRMHSPPPSHRPAGTSDLSSSASASAATPTPPVSYHTSVQLAQTYQRKQGGQDTPWLNASNRQRFAFSTHTGQTTEHTTPVPLDTSGRSMEDERKRQEYQQQQGGEEPRRASLNSGIMPNFLVMPSLSSIARQRTAPTAVADTTSSTLMPQPQPQSQPATVLQQQQSISSVKGSPSLGALRASPPIEGSSLPPPGQASRPLRVDSALPPTANGGVAPSPASASASSSSASPRPPVAPSPSSASWSLRDSWRLHDEICVFSNYVSEVTTMRQPILVHMIDLIRECVQTLWPTAEVECYGSFMTGLCLPTSDLDLVLKGTGNSNQQQAIVQLASVLRKQKDWLQSLNAISTAKVPVIKLLACLEGEEIVVDITFDQPPPAAPATIPEQSNGTGASSMPSSPSLAPAASPVVHTGVASVELIRQYLLVFPSLRPLSLVLKQFLFERGLANTYTGGLNSYCLILMIVSFLQSRPWPYQAYQHAQAQLQAKAQTHVLDQLMTAHQRTPRVEMDDSAATSVVPSPLTSPQRSSLSVGRPRASSTFVQAAVQRIEMRLQLEAIASHTNSLPATPTMGGTRVGMIRLPQLQLLPPSAASSPRRSPSQSPPSSSSLSPTSLTSSPPTPAYGRAATTENLGSLLIEFLNFFGCHFDFQTMAIGVTLPPTWQNQTPTHHPPQQQPQQQQAANYAPPPYASAASAAPYESASSSSWPSVQAAPLFQSTLPMSSAAAAASASGAPPPLVPLHQYNYLSLLPSHALPADWKHLKSQMAQLLSTQQSACGGQWGHGCYYSLSGASRVLLISDPFSPLLSNNIGRSVFAMWRIKQAFAEGHTLLAAKLAVHGAAPTLLARIIQKMQQHHKRPTSGLGTPTAGLVGSAAHNSHGTPGRESHAPVKGLTHIMLPPAAERPLTIQTDTEAHVRTIDIA